MEIIKKYQKDNFTIIWKPEKCIHAGTCVKTLPQVYKPKEKPWITPEKASIKDLKNQIDACPSGALSYEDPTS
ncbi:(4Fe-4S)-binding protein [Aquimarina pacifica]|uniref:(4Fe-4S)-binding protein n=1 Tax=Aquimarina pacifica TaxID=1296415 RepID=UPI000470D0EE|nr:(4Fe-4S)-binding protein [Aquimarina pacifica]